MDFSYIYICCGNDNLLVIFIAEDKLPVALPFASTLGGNADILIHKEKDQHSSFCQKSNNKQIF
jgi:hypothetical protein